MVTRPAKYDVTCNQCDVPLQCPQCAATQKNGTPFSLWLRSTPEGTDNGKNFDSRYVSNHNLDFIWHNYKEHWFMLIEEKRFGAIPSTDAQRDTHGMLHQMLVAASGHKVTTVWRGVRPIQYIGYYKIVFEKTTPDDSDWIRINYELVTREQLIKFLQLGLKAGLNLPTAPHSFKKNSNLQS